MSAVKIPVIGIIGGIGSGKTAMAMALDRIMSVCQLNADLAGHQVLTYQKTKDSLEKVFGSKIFDETGEIDRSEIARRVFGIEEHHKLARQKLDEITHPSIRELLRSQLKKIQHQQTCDVIILDAALLLEAGWAEECDRIVYLEVPDQVRLQRVLERGWTEQQFKDREASQLSLEVKAQKSDIIIENSGSIDVAASKLAEWIRTQF